MPTPPDFTAGTSLAAASLNKIGMWAIATSTFTNVASIQINDCFTSDYVNYRIVLNLYSTATGARYAWFRLVDGTTPTTTNYWGKSLWTVQTDVSLTPGTYDARTDRGCLGPIGYAANGEGAYVLDIHEPQVARNTRVEMLGQGLYAGTAWYMVNGATVHIGTTSFEGIQFFPSADNITGNVTVYGYNTI